MSSEGRVLLEGLAFPEGPRWHDGRFWFSDMHLLTVVALDEHGNREEVVRVEGCPSGLGWLPDGRLLVVSMNDRRLLRLETDGQIVEVADLSELAAFHCNDMIVDREGRAYIGNFGYDLMSGDAPAPANLILVTPEGHAQVAAKDLTFPNGMVITPDGSTLVVGETFAARLTAFDIAADGSLSNRRIWASLPDASPDGICLDTAGGIWVASPTSSEVLRVLEGGEITDRIPVETKAFACMLGGEEGRTLFVCTAGGSVPSQCIANRDGRIETFLVEHGRAGLP